MTQIDIETVRSRVQGHWSSVEYVDSIGSTNTELLSRGTPGAVLIAGEQTAGKGRLGRPWQSPRGTQFAFSMLIDAPSVQDIGLIPLTAGLAVTDVITQARLKWPNDVQIDGKKLAGILAEADFSGDKPHVVVGIGLNVALEKKDLPVENATSLLLEGIEYDWTALATDLLNALGRRLSEPLDLDAYRAVCSTIGQNVRLIAPGGDVYGVAEDVSPTGEIIVDGTPYSAGDVTHLRPQV
ncbi:biotin--[acetyl-CoA-carboxylase] ligase [Corynebacterium breve]|uniref:biotin--[biotin carboxyl-carrier protein] ligase n=1 Tax=Corynebacterium breve TaxID=3049799 RepID=A0ABY8VHZ8_9CORY|nr:biotin--[acetyl-CoA-carboxylase] ligase [Corynebacterium breve]WIM68243.1 biotin--[acetyl-CoA-carboxylase] ligase [Corynebacterium breve]